MSYTIEPFYVKSLVSDNDCHKNVTKINVLLSPRNIEKFPNESKPNKINTPLWLFVCFSFLQIFDTTILIF